ncbi:holo-[acyl-carrier-protein] synthase [candidate division WOR-3 bacterium 4484_100]|uniref:Holo-[acyl-carrier-protein] synthase n=1 Tax=candidate division WOR-3 bacterium 4484_100 TaxID=1936077 RepID=A0A1V4QGT5_UNCW3|nr:MAG: holo-[acyl-carrier-protein] synthase [candidate division WOR-3 bacterium 4484_100]
MVLGIGIDIIEVSRIKSATMRRKKFLDNIYAPEEIRLSERGEFRYEELAGRFAAKEAFFKAIKTGWRQGVKFNEVVVLNEKSGAPYIKLKGRTAEIARTLSIKEIFVSISHTKDLAVGVVVITN